jgi:hypothetical protein
LQHEIYSIEEEIDFDSAIFKLNRGDFVISSKLNGKPTQSNADQSEPLLHILANDLGGQWSKQCDILCLFDLSEIPPCQKFALPVQGQNRLGCNKRGLSKRSSRSKMIRRQKWSPSVK